MCCIQSMEESLILPIFRKLRFVDCNKPFWKKLMYKAFVRAKCGCDKWHDYGMSIAPYDKDKPIYYEFTSCLPQKPDKFCRVFCCFGRGISTQSTIACGYAAVPPVTSLNELFFSQKNRLFGRYWFCFGTIKFAPFSI